MNKTQLLEKIKPGDKVYFNFNMVSQKYLSVNGWYEYEGLRKCDSSCAMKKGADICPGKTKFKGLNSECLVWDNIVPVTEIKTPCHLPEHLFEINI